MDRESEEQRMTERMRRGVRSAERQHWLWWRCSRTAADVARETSSRSAAHHLPLLTFLLSPHVVKWSVQPQGGRGRRFVDGGDKMQTLVHNKRSDRQPMLLLRRAIVTTVTVRAQS